MTNSIEMASIDDQNPLISQTEKDKIEEGSKVDHSINIIQSIAKKFKDLDNSSIKSRTMFKVNVWLRESNPDAYTPKMVSIGPYHKRDVQLPPMEKYKLLYLRRFLERKEGLGLESCIKELEGLKEKALKCYDDVETDEFCQMLLLDGCFVVEFIRECCGICPEGEDKIMNSDIFIMQDLMLLENQLPFFVLAKLHDMTKQGNESPLAILVSMSFPLLVDLPKTTLKSFIETGGCYKIKHILHLVHILSCHGNRENKLENNDDQTWHTVMPNAIKLSEAGVSFEKVNVTTTLFDSIKFEKGLMKIPHFNIVDSTEIFLRNLIAYEQQSADVHPKYFSDFATFMDHLIDSDKDVNLFRQKGIIDNWIGEDKGVANLFNKIGNGVITYPNFYYKEECIKACQHCKKPWNRWMASLKHNYFSTPWVGASTVAAFILLFLTTIQTVLAFTGSIQ